MARAYIIIGIALMLAASTGCNRYHVEDILLPRNEISLTVKGADQIIYDEESFISTYSILCVDVRLLVADSIVRTYRYGIG